MDKLTLKDRNILKDGVANGIVEMRSLDGKLIFRKHNMITLSGRKFIFNKVFGDSSNSLRNGSISKIFIGENYGITYSGMTYSDLNLDNSNIYDLSDAKISYNLLESEDLVYMNTISNKKIYSLAAVPAELASRNGNDITYSVCERYKGNFITNIPSLQYTIADDYYYAQFNETSGSGSVYRSIKFPIKKAIANDGEEFKSSDRLLDKDNVKANNFLLIDDEYTYVNMSSTYADRMPNFIKFCKYFGYEFDGYELVTTSLSSNTMADFLFGASNYRSFVENYLAVPYVAEATYSVNSTTGTLTMHLPAEKSKDSEQAEAGGTVDIVLATAAIISDEPFIKITKVFDGNDVNKSITELGLIYSYTEDDTNVEELFSRVIFEAVPMVSGDYLEVSYYVYF